MSKNDKDVYLVLWNDSRLFKCELYGPDRLHG